MVKKNIKQASHLTHKGNSRNSRYGWLRLTPAYSISLVENILSSSNKDDIVYDPYCGTGTTALVCAEKGIKAETSDINPYLIWLAKVKTTIYSSEDIESLTEISSLISKKIDDIKIAKGKKEYWTPNIFQIEKWWDENTLHILAGIFDEIKKVNQSSVSDLLRIIFSKVMIDSSRASFNHQSMSFKKGDITVNDIDILSLEITQRWNDTSSSVITSAVSTIKEVPHVFLSDAREITKTVEGERYTTVITSPPYPNRMSYIRELRPYMYWLGYLNESREAGELDWKAIGGTWGIATSNLSRWLPDSTTRIDYKDFYELIEKVNSKSSVMATYIHKYFEDMVLHSNEIFKVMKKGGSIHYVVGNSKFYDTVIPVEEIFASIFTSVGFTDVNIDVIRKRNSKKELYEFVVSAKKPR